MTPNELYELLKKAQEPKGFFFNRDKEWVLSILSDLLVNKQRYGYTAAHAVWHPATGRATGTLFVLAPTGRPTCANTAAVFVIYMSHRTGTRIKFLMFTFRNADRRKKPPSSFFFKYFIDKRFKSP